MHGRRTLICLAAASLVLSQGAVLSAPQPALAAADTQVVTPKVYNMDGDKSKRAYVKDSSSPTTFSLVRSVYTQKDYASRTLKVVSDSNYAGTYSTPYGYKLSGKERISITLTGTGKHVLVIREVFKDANGKAVHYTDYSVTLRVERIGLECNDNGLENGIGNDSVIAYPKAERTITLSNIKDATNWKVTSQTPQDSGTTVATVSKEGALTCVSPGRCYVTVKGASAVTGNKDTFKILVEVTSKKAYRAVQNAYKDYFNPKIKYSQGNRMNKNYRDCSSYVGRCYYDANLSRKLLSIGGASSKSWALPAADQAKWLYSHGGYVKGGKTVKGKKALALKKLLPGDTIYYNGSRKSINAAVSLGSIGHAAIYVGNGLVLNVSGSDKFGPYGAVRFRGDGYSAKDTTIIFVGRPSLAK